MSQIASSSLALLLAGPGSSCNASVGSGLSRAAGSYTSSVACCVVVVGASGLGSQGHGGEDNELIEGSVSWQVRVSHDGSRNIARLPSMRTSLRWEDAHHEKTYDAGELHVGCWDGVRVWWLGVDECCCRLRIWVTVITDHVGAGRRLLYSFRCINALCFSCTWFAAHARSHS